MKKKVMQVMQWYDSLSDKQKVILKCMAAMGICIFAVAFFLMNQESFYGIDGNGNASLLKKKVVIYFGSFFSYVLCLFVKNPFKAAGNRVLNIQLMEWFPLVCFVLVETVCGGNLSHMRMYRFVLNLLLYMLVMYLIFAITASVKASVIGISVFAALFAAVNVYLVEFRQIPLLASDFTVIKTAFNVAGDFTYRLNADIILLICFVIAVFCFAQKISQEKPSKRFRILTAVCYLIFLTGMLQFTVFSNRLAELKVNINTFRPIKTYKNNGGLLTFTRSIRLMLVEKPEEYGKKQVKELTEKFESDSVGADGFMEPNVVVIMNEAFADLQDVGNFETNQEVMPFYRSLEENTVKGYAYVSVFGGQTANSEFEFLTGDTKAFLPNGATPYQLYVKKYVPSLTGNLKKDGYQGMLALHPFRKSGYNRVSVYENLGFERFITMDDFENPVYVRQFISDQSDYDRIISEYEAAKAQSDAPFYLFNVTMQNHSSYDTDYDNLPKTITITTPECKNADAERYLNLIHISDAQNRRLLEYFAQQEEPTVVVMFGDHEPGLSDGFYSSIMGKSVDSLIDAENMEMYKVPFFIWANYDIEEKYIEKTSLNYLRAIMLDVAGMKKSGYDKFLLSLMEDIPAINVSGYYGADGVYYNKANTLSPYYARLKEYNILEYNHLFDAKRQDAFFELRE